MGCLRVVQVVDAGVHVVALLLLLLLLTVILLLLLLQERIRDQGRLRSVNLLLLLRLRWRRRVEPVLGPNRGLIIRHWTLVLALEQSGGLLTCVT